MKVSFMWKDFQLFSEQLVFNYSKDLYSLIDLSEENYEMKLFNIKTKETHDYFSLYNILLFQVTLTKAGHVHLK